MITRRGMLLGLLAAPAVIRTPGLLMPVRTPVLTNPCAEIMMPPVIRAVTWVRSYRYVVDYVKADPAVRWYRVDEDGMKTEVQAWQSELCDSVMAS